MSSQRRRQRRQAKRDAEKTTPTAGSDDGVKGHSAAVRDFVKTPGLTNEAKVTGRALVERWPMSQQQREKMVDRLIEISQSVDLRAATAAMNALIKADSVNLKQAELWLAEHGPPEQEDDDFVIESDPELIRLEAEKMARKAEISQANAGGSSMGSNWRELVIAKAHNAVEQRNNTRCDDAEQPDDNLDASSAR